MYLAASDPTGLSTPWGQLIVGVGLVASLVVAGRLWWQQRKR